jgi:hypothetical protein
MKELNFCVDSGEGLLRNHHQEFDIR